METKLESISGCFPYSPRHFYSAIKNTSLTKPNTVKRQWLPRDLFSTGWVGQLRRKEKAYLWKESKSSYKHPMKHSTTTSENKVSVIPKTTMKALQLHGSMHEAVSPTPCFSGSRGCHALVRLLIQKPCCSLQIQQQNGAVSGNAGMTTEGLTELHKMLRYAREFCFMKNFCCFTDWRPITLFSLTHTDTKRDSIIPRNQLKASTKNKNRSA